MRSWSFGSPFVNALSGVQVSRCAFVKACAYGYLIFFLPICHELTFQIILLMFFPSADVESEVLFKKLFLGF